MYPDAPSRKASPLVLTTIPEGTAPVPTRPAAGPAIPPRMRRRPLTFAALTRQAARRASWAQAEPLALPKLAFVSSIASALTLQVTTFAVLLMVIR